MTNQIFFIKLLDASFWNICNVSSRIVTNSRMGTDPRGDRNSPLGTLGTEHNITSNIVYDFQAVVSHYAHVLKQCRCPFSCYGCVRANPFFFFFF